MNSPSNLYKLSQIIIYEVGVSELFRTLSLVAISTHSKLAIRRNLFIAGILSLGCREKAPIVSRRLFQMFQEGRIDFFGPSELKNWPGVGRRNQKELFRDVKLIRSGC